MNYKGFSILHDKIINRWCVKVDVFTEWLALDERDAKRQVDEYMARKSLQKAA